MALNADSLTKETQNGLGFSKEATSAKNKAFAKAIVTHVQTGIVSFAPGSITGTAPSSGGPLSNAVAKGGKIALVPATLEAALSAALGASTPQISAFAKAISGYIMASGLVEFASGTLTAAATNTPSSPGAVTGSGKNGKIKGLVGDDMAKLVSIAIGQSSVSSELKKMCTAICDHIQKNGEVSLPSVVGVASGGGGPIQAGAAAGGIIS